VRGEFTIGPLYAAHLGDALCLTPLPRLLTAHRCARVYVQAEHSHRIVFANSPFVAGFRPDGGMRMDALVGQRGHVIQRLQRRFRLRVDGCPRPEVYLSDSEVTWACGNRDQSPMARR